MVYFDVEDLTFADPPLVTRPHTYMLGVVTPDGNSRIWTARGQDDEERMWSDFLDWLGDPHDVALYCWTMYERRKMEQAAAAHPQLTSRLQTAAAALVDLKEEIKHQPYFPVPSYCGGAGLRLPLEPRRRRWSVRPAHVSAVASVGR